MQGYSSSPDHIKHNRNKRKLNIAILLGVRKKKGVNRTCVKEVEKYTLSVKNLSAEQRRQSCKNVNVNINVNLMSNTGSACAITLARDS